MGKKNKARIKKSKAKRSQSGVSADVSEPNYDTMPPIFSLERIQATNYCLSKLCKDDKAAFSDSIYKRKQVTWSDIKKIGRHSLGFEKISKSSIKAPIPTFITDDVDHFLAFRFSGMKPMVGYRNKNVFFVLWFDHDFTLYDHG